MILLAEIGLNFLFTIKKLILLNCHLVDGDLGLNEVKTSGDAGFNLAKRAVLQQFR